MIERDFQRLWGQWLKTNPSPNTIAYELKIVKNGRFSFDQVAAHQITGLQQAKRGQYIKLQDMSAVNGFANPKPWDCVWVQAKEAYVGVLFYTPRKPKKVLLVPIEEFIKLKEVWPKKSIHYDNLWVTPGVEAITL